MHRVGIEEELFVVDDGGRLVPESEAVLRAHRRLEPGDELDHELFLQQVELQTEPQLDPDALREDLISQRSAAVAAARAVGVHVVAVPVDVLGGTEPIAAPGSRRSRMLARFGDTSRNGLTSAMHVHVEVPDRAAVRVLDVLRPWTPMLTALAANSPFHHGRDTRQSSWRGHQVDTWPTAGAAEPYGDRKTYRELIDAAIESGAAMDAHMFYPDVRIAEDYPTVEVRVTDVCTDVEDALLVAELCRALVATAVSSDLDTGTWRVEVLRGARWRARHDGLEGHLLEPFKRSFVPAEQALDSLLTTVRPALDEAGTSERVHEGLHRLLTEGNGATRQRAVAGDPPDLDAVMADLIRRTDPRDRPHVP